MSLPHSLICGIKLDEDMKVKITLEGLLQKRVVEC
jgi:hypothetical protein